jgi:hypothetical protein
MRNYYIGHLVASVAFLIVVSLDSGRDLMQGCAAVMVIGSMFFAIASKEN